MKKLPYLLMNGLRLMSNVYYPTLEDCRLTSSFGWRTHPVTGVRTFHDGIDLAPKIPGTVGVPVFATRSGKIIRAGTHYSMGNYIYLKHTNDPYLSIYMHLASFTIGLNDIVDGGQQIGFQGQTGRVTGIHLHFGISTTNPPVFGVGGSHIDPLPYLEGSYTPPEPPGPDDPVYPIPPGFPDHFEIYNTVNFKPYIRRR